MPKRKENSNLLPSTKVRYILTDKVRGPNRKTILRLLGATKEELKTVDRDLSNREQWYWAKDTLYKRKCKEVGPHDEVGLRTAKEYLDRLDHIINGTPLKKGTIKNPLLVIPETFQVPQNKTTHKLTKQQKGILYDLNQYYGVGLRRLGKVTNLDFTGISRQINRMKDGKEMQNGGFGLHKRTLQKRAANAR